MDRCGSVPSLDLRHLEIMSSNLTPWQQLARFKTVVITVLALLAIAVHLVLWFGMHAPESLAERPLIWLLIFGGVPLVLELTWKLIRLEFGSDLLGGISIVTSVLLGEYLAGSIIVLMLSGGEALENYALRSASSVLSALARRTPTRAHRRTDQGTEEVALDEIQAGDDIVIYPHEVVPVDGIVIEGHGTMDESYLTGEPFQMTKTIGSSVLSGAINGEAVLTVNASRLAVDSRYAQIMRVMQESEQSRPQLRRLGDQLGAWYTPLALTIACLAWGISGDPVRFLAVLVIATPCPLLIAIPVSIIGSISLCARRAIVVKSPVALEQMPQCRTAIFDKTGTLTYGLPTLTEISLAPGFSPEDVLKYAATLEIYSKHPLASAIIRAAQAEGLVCEQTKHVSEPPGQGLRGDIDGRRIRITHRKQLLKEAIAGSELLPPQTGGLECIVLLDDQYAATFKFRDAPRKESHGFIRHLGPRHQFRRIMILSGDREPEVRYLAEEVGISEIHAEQQPEQKLERVRQETARAKTLYLGDGINDAPAMQAATVGMSIGLNSDVTAAAADVVIMDNSLSKVDEFLHISRRMRHIALQSAGGGMLLSALGMLLAACGYLTPVQGAVAQEVIDVLAVFNALRAAWLPRILTDMEIAP